MFPCFAEIVAGVPASERCPDFAAETERLRLAGEAVAEITAVLAGDAPTVVVRRVVQALGDHPEEAPPRVARDRRVETHG